MSISYGCQKLILNERSPALVWSKCPEEWMEGPCIFRNKRKTWEEVQYRKV